MKPIRRTTAIRILTACLALTGQSWAQVMISPGALTDVSLTDNNLSITADVLTGGSQHHLEYSPDLTTLFADVPASTFTAAGPPHPIDVTVAGTKCFFRVASGA